MGMQGPKERGARRLIPRERLERVLGLPDRAGRLSSGAKTAILFGVLALIVLLVALYDPRPSLRHVKVAVASGSTTGNYYATIEKIGAQVARQKGRLQNLPSAGSVENIQRLIEAAENCRVQFALVQDGIEWPPGHPLELIGRLPQSESLILLGRDADRITAPEQLRGLRIGIGPVGSGTEYLMRGVMAQLSSLDLKTSTQSIDRQLDMLQRGELDLGAMVISDEAQLVVQAVRDRNLQILSIPDAGSLARRLPFARLGTIEAGQYDYARRLPPERKQVLNVDTLLIGNGCASLSQTQGLMTAVAEVFPTFVAHNRGQPNLTGLPLNPVAKTFFDEQGPDVLGKFAPWLVDIMPMPNWLQLIVGFSMLFSGMALAHRFRLWRIDDARVKIERDIPALFGPGTTIGDITRAVVEDRHRTPEARAKLDEIIERLVALSDRCRRQSLSVLVPMGQEMSYRYQETLIADLLHALRVFRQALGGGQDGTGAPRE
jgi:TRAP-type uncharacterized transport system substrate-binding protein